MAKYRLRILGLLVTFGDEVLDAVRDAKHINVDDVRAAVLDPLRAAAAQPPVVCGDGNGDELMEAMMMGLG